jgi:hypothetical protein
LRRRADDLGLDYGHFTGQRRWSDADLVDAVKHGTTWGNVLERLGLANTGGGSAAAIREHARRLGLGTDHLASAKPTLELPFPMDPRREQLRKAGAMFAAAWFTLCGHEVVWPLEPCRYDFAVRASDAFHRVQVKTTTYRSGSASAVSISNSRRRGRVMYAPDEIDFFFIIDETLDAYLIPFAAVAGLQHIHLRRYRAYLVAAGGRWLAPMDGRLTA